MRTREKLWSDYGIRADEVADLMADCRNPDNAAALMAAVTRVTPEGLREAIYISLSQGRGFVGTTKCTAVYCTRNDYYGYRRRAAAAFYHDLHGLRAYQDDDSKLDTRVVPCSTYEKLSKYGGSKRKKPHKA